ncbi:hypothetical protein NCPPB3778_34 [Rathayibacter phage NCPPB3778]|nr:hypothetical protein NCPPB3778_34 [Rathayibacter phage NCPPB3778]
MRHSHEARTQSEATLLWTARSQLAAIEDAFNRAVNYPPLDGGITRE